MTRFSNQKNRDLTNRGSKIPQSSSLHDPYVLWYSYQIIALGSVEINKKKKSGRGCETEIMCPIPAADTFGWRFVGKQARKCYRIKYRRSSVRCFFGLAFVKEGATRPCGLEIVHRGVFIREKIFSV